MNKIIDIDPERRVARVQAGTTWRQLQDALDPHGLAVKTMQTYSDFSVGGTVGVNGHGRYIGNGPIARSVRDITVVLADGSVRRADRKQNPDLFKACIGTFGAAGVIADVELDLATNDKLERRIEFFDTFKDYQKHFSKKIAIDGDAVMHSADLAFPDFKKVTSETWYRSSKPLTVKKRFASGVAPSVTKPIFNLLESIEHQGRTKLPPSLSDPLVKQTLKAKSAVEAKSPYLAERLQVNLATHLPSRLAGLIRQALEHRAAVTRKVTTRNYQASKTIQSIKPFRKNSSTFSLQEYFVPEENASEFAAKIAPKLKNKGILNVSVRHTEQDVDSAMPWAKDNMHSFVIYHRQGTSAKAQRKVQKWTRDLIDLTLDHGGRYYLPYQLHATLDQFRSSYPEYEKLIDIKRKYDPNDKFSNQFLDTYLI